MQEEEGSDGPHAGLHLLEDVARGDSEAVRGVSVNA